MLKLTWSHHDRDSSLVRHKYNLKDREGVRGLGALVKKNQGISTKKERETQTRKHFQFGRSRDALHVVRSCRNFVFGMLNLNALHTLESCLTCFSLDHPLVLEQLPLCVDPFGWRNLKLLMKFSEGL